MTTGVSMKRFAYLIAAVAATLLLNGCLGGAVDLGSSAPAPTDVRAVAGDSSVTLTWTGSPNVEYWVFAAPGSNVTTANWDSMGGSAFPKVTSPHVVSGLTNGTTYSFTINGRIDGGPGGPGSTTISAVPRLAGASWNVDSALGSSSLNGATFGAIFVAVGNDGVLYSSPDFNSYTPATWTALTNPTSSPRANLYATIYGGVYLAAGAGGAMLRSTDAITWTQHDANSSGNDLYGLATNGIGGYVAVGQNGAIVTSVDGQSWTRQTSGTSNDLHAVAFGNGVWVAVGKSGIVLTSSNGSTWTAIASNTSRNLKSVAYGIAVNTATSTTSPVFIAVGAAGTQVTSTDYGATWTAGVINNGVNNLNAVSYGRQFIVAGSNGALFTSTDGANWTAQAAGTSNDLNAIAHSTTNISVVGASGTNLSAL